MKLRKTVLLISAIIGASLLFSLYQSYKLYEASVSAHHLVSHTNEVLSNIQNLISNTYRYQAITEKRLHAGAGAVQANRAAAIQAIRGQMQTLRTLTHDNSRQRQQLELLEQALQQALEGLEDPGTSPAAATAQWDAHSADILNLLSGIKAEEERLLLQRTERFEHYSHFRFLFSIGVFTLVGTFWIISLYRIRQGRRHHRATAEQAKLIESRYRMLIEGSGITLMVIDKEGLIQFASDNIEQLTGYQPSELIGRLSTESIRNRLLETDEENMDHEYALMRKDGERRWIAYRQTPICNSTGAVLEYQVMLWDIDQEKRTRLQMEELEAQQRKQQQLLQDIIDHIPLSVVLKDLSGSYILVNNQVREFFRNLTPEVVGKRLSDFLNNKKEEEDIRSIEEQVMREGKAITYEREYQIDGVPAHYLVIRFPIFNEQGAVKYVGGISTNITELRQKTQAMETARKEAERARAGQELFFTNMSHEIRTPLNGILGMAHLLQGTGLDEEQHNFVDTIVESSQDLLAIINDLLDLSKIKSGKFSFANEPFDPRASFQRALHSLRFKAEEKNTRLSILLQPELPESLTGDALRLQQIVINLVNNAIKFTPNGTVTVTIGGTMRQDRQFQLRIVVQDTGIGIRPEKIAHIFDSFVQDEQGRKTAQEGTGLGLAIVRQLTELRKGTISVESKPGNGSIFTVELPLETAPESSKMPAQKPEPAPSHDLMLHDLNILVAEDNPINLKVIETVLKKQGARVTLVRNGREAVEALTKEAYDLVLMDLQMPVMDGYEATRAIRQELKSEVPVLALSADAFIGESEKCAEAGMNDYLSKPFDPAELFRKVKALTGNQQPVAAGNAAGKPLVNLDFLNELSTGDAGYNREIIEIFLRTVPQGLANMDHYLQGSPDYEALHQQAHQLRSSFSVVRIGNAFDILGKIEQQAAAKDDIARLRQYLDEVQQLFVQAQPELQHLREAK